MKWIYQQQAKQLFVSGVDTNNENSIQGSIMTAKEIWNLIGMIIMMIVFAAIAWIWPGN